MFGGEVWIITTYNMVIIDECVVVYINFKIKRKLKKERGNKYEQR